MFKIKLMKSQSALPAGGQIPPSDFQIPPGVHFVEERGPDFRIYEVSTHIAAFVGYTQKSCGEGPVHIRNLEEFTRIFGGGDSAPLSYTLYYCIFLYFVNGGSECMVVSAGGLEGERCADDLIKGLWALKADISAAIVAVPEAVMLPDVAGCLAVQREMLRFCGESDYMRFAILDLYGGDEEMDASVKEFRAGIGNSYLDCGAAYFPWVKLPLYRLNSELILPASPLVAAVYGIVDNSRGVWKAPANESARYVTGCSIKLTQAQVMKLTSPSDGGVNINAIILAPGVGITLWGARTLIPEAVPARFINVKRTLSFLKSSISSSLNCFLCEPNSPETWRSIEKTVSSYLEGFRLRGGFFGTSSAECFRVSAGSAADSGIDSHEWPADQTILVKVEVAMIKPGEFIEL
ncbi:MAG: hypothetical protein CVT93_09585 [Bacteroidetes bacterium HGW-Bacteroidetes-10]|jgi:phage tail sheath protein FI|nr:MAG: hypothetical protein CVT93_09585 [Bacteroidetes bacterium HGW-Bacteroidetes-10]